MKHNTAAAASSSPRKDGTQSRTPHDGTNMIVEYLKFALLLLIFASAAVCLHIQQWLGTPLYLCNRAWFDAWQRWILKATCLIVLALNQWRAPVTAQVSCDASVRGQIHRTPNGKLVFDFPSRIVLVANHQIYTDWFFLWWSAYTKDHHPYLIIVLKDAIGKIPILGRGMTFFNWIFLSRKWEADKPRLEKSISRLSDPSQRSPMWLLIFPEGTNLSKRSLAISKKWADKNGLPHSDLTLLPRTRGLRTCLEGLASSVDWMYDCTIAYDHIPQGVDGQDIYNLKSLYIEGRKAPITHTHWRRFAIKDIPFHDADAFDKWMYARWAEKDRLLEHFHSHGRFPSDDGYVEVKMDLHSSWEIAEVLVCLLSPVVAWFMVKWVYLGTMGLFAFGRQMRS